MKAQKRNGTQNAYQETTSTLKSWKESKNKSQKFTKAIELSPSIVLITNRQGLIEYANPTFVDTSGYEPEEITGKGLWFLTCDITSKDEYQELMQAIAEGRGWKGELMNRSRQGDPYALSIEVAPYQDEYGDVTNFLITGQDVTPFRQTENKLNEAMKEQTVLLSELHHRVKNNLAVISGLMELQAFNEEEKVLKDKLFTGVGRIQTMASMHELLYESESLSEINFKPYIEKIIDCVAGKYPRAKSKIDVKLDVEPIVLSVKQGHPCSLILNEVITNVYKHAYTEQEAGGVLAVQFYQKNGAVYMFISDNGKGLTNEQVASNHNKLGMKLLKTLVRQLGGEFRYEGNSSGTTFYMKFDMIEVDVNKAGY
ncbi:MAG: PAS domain S-box protein [Balneolaceae bacterium]|nr:PAS domain S-box protein [Balneolaceae bacterium]